MNAKPSSHRGTAALGGAKCQAACRTAGGGGATPVDESIGVTAPLGFRAGAAACGVKKLTEKPDVGVLVCDVPARAAAVFTRNRVVAAPVLVSQRTSGPRNACAASSPTAATPTPARAGRAWPTPARWPASPPTGSAATPKRCSSPPPASSDA